MSNSIANGLNGYGYNPNGYYNNTTYGANPNNNPSSGFPAVTQAHSRYNNNTNTPSYAYDTYSTSGNPVNNANVQYPVDTYSSYQSNVQTSYSGGVHYTNYPNYTSNVQGPGHINPPNYNTATGYTPSMSTLNPQAAPYVCTSTAQTGAQETLLSNHPLFAQWSAQPANVYSPPMMPQQYAAATTEPSRLLSEHWAFAQPSASTPIAGQKPLLSEHPVFAQVSVQGISPETVNTPTATRSTQHDVYAPCPSPVKEQVRKPRGMIGQMVDAGMITPPDQYLAASTAQKSMESAESKALHDSFVAEQMRAAESMPEDEKTKKKKGKAVKGKAGVKETGVKEAVEMEADVKEAGVKEAATKPQTKESVPSTNLTSQREAQKVQGRSIAKPSTAETERKALVAKTRRLVAIELDAKETGPITSIRRSKLDDEIWKETHARMARLDASQEEVKTPVAGTMGYVGLTPRIEGSERPDWVNHLGLALPGMKRKVPVVTPPSSSDLDRLSPLEQIAGGKRKRTVDGDETPSKKAKTAPVAEAAEHDHAVLEAATPPVSSAPLLPPAPATNPFATTGDPAATAEKKRKRGDDDDAVAEEPAQKAAKLDGPELLAGEEQTSPPHHPLVSAPPAVPTPASIPLNTTIPTAESNNDDNDELEAALFAELSKPSNDDEEPPPAPAGASADTPATRKRRPRGFGKEMPSALLRKAVRRDREEKGRQPKVEVTGPKQKRPGMRMGEKPTGVGKKR
ncbi:hypothetical protein LTR91_012977 [Friedmanniomyces endolithicus]|uniref:Uncharacterized protein n=1 Tax=Friedmanniomyces endolithicus TaxID=329885 RepID=A0A4U0V539_9PEZI|nr:hypothetical protein LTR91_012977 [Friedmanniomyces endolithicus]KAK0995911.1 hypothetical protein LTS01_006608 [Friedmanniomyces endolithicus]KAK1052320.1 hypothetical protein LTS16_002000 [Friedmanniomyces endolithicus]TKA42865.1 hypothetical protein B0A54_07081 [Friedmanniomyces endolithicus]